MMVKKRLLIINNIVFIFLTLMLLLNLYVLVSNVAFKESMVKVFGFSRTVVLSGSMEPAIEAGDLLIIKEKKQYNVGDIVTYKWGKSYATHRIVDIYDGEIITKGDNNNMEDEPVLNSLIEGKVVFRIRNAGNIILFFKTPLGILSLVVFGILALEIPHIIRKVKNK